MHLLCHKTNEFLRLNFGMFLPFRKQIEQNFIVRIKIVHSEGGSKGNDRLQGDLFLVDPKQDDGFAKINVQHR